jgi:ATP-dependent RNA helicase RhlB
MSLPDIEDFIGHKIPVANYDPALMPEIIKPKRKPRQQSGSQRNRSGGSRDNRGSRRRPPPRRS